MVVGLLISLTEGVVVGLTSPVVPETTEVGFHLISFFNFNSHTFYLHKIRVDIVTYLIVLHPDFYLELVGHDELVSLD